MLFSLSPHPQQPTSPSASGSIRPMLVPAHVLQRAQNIKPISRATNFTRYHLALAASAPATPARLHPADAHPYPHSAACTEYQTRFPRDKHHPTLVSLSPHAPPHAPAKMPRGGVRAVRPPVPIGHKKRSDLVSRPRLNVCFTARKALPSKPLLSRRGLGWLSASVGGVPPIQGQTPKLLQVHGDRPVPR